MNVTATNRISPANHAGFLTQSWIDWMTRIIETIGIWRQRHRSRRHLARLDSRLLRDIGIDQVDCLIESNKPFWEE